MGTVESVERYLKKLRKQKPIYYGVTARNLSPEELAKITIPTRYLSAVRIGLVSRIDRVYGASHIAKHPCGPYILLRSADEIDLEDFTEVDRVIAEITVGKREGNISPDFDLGLYDVIRLNKVPTTKRVAAYVKKYSALFKDVTIQFVFYNRVPHKVYYSAGIPSDKLTIEEPIPYIGYSRH